MSKLTPQSWKTLPEKPFYDTADLPEMQALEANWSVFKNEIPAMNVKTTPLTERPRDAWQAEHKDLAQNREADWLLGWDKGVEWYNFPLVFHGASLKGVHTLCPQTMAVLDTLPQIQIAGFATLTAKQKMSLHRDDTGRRFNSIAINLALVCPDANLYTVWMDGLTYDYHHQDGKLVAFDSNLQHWADNHDTDPRTILYLDWKLEGSD